MELDPRKSRILTCVVESYIRTGEPIGSKMIAAMLEDTVEENAAASAQTQEAPVSEKEEASLPISASAIIELAAGGAIMALFFFEAISADKNGSKIFLPADVNLLFPSPMKPQSVLMFRLATQLGKDLGKGPGR